jgi:hypothetical protein
MNALALRERVTKLITSYGIAATLSSFSNIAPWVEKFDTVEAKKYWQNSTTQVIVYADPGPTTVAIKIAEKTYKQYEIDGTNILVSDRRFIILADTTVTSDDRLIINNKTYQILPPIKIIGFQDIVIAYEVHCRG